MSNLLMRTPYNGKSSLPDLHDRLFPPIDETFERFFNEFFSPSNLSRTKSNTGYPKVDIGYEGDEYVVKAAVPGVLEEDLDVEIAPSSEGREILKISGKTSEEYKSCENASYQVRELCKRNFVREFLLPENLEGDPKASMKDGLLILRWATKPNEEKSVNRKIPISKE
jgi:HSP20 family molecular chaperone IbpA